MLTLSTHHSNMFFMYYGPLALQEGDEFLPIQFSLKRLNMLFIKNI